MSTPPQPPLPPLTPLQWARLRRSQRLLSSLFLLLGSLFFIDGALLMFDPHFLPVRLLSIESPLMPLRVLWGVLEIGVALLNWAAVRYGQPVWRRFVSLATLIVAACIAAQAIIMTIAHTHDLERPLLWLFVTSLSSIMYSIEPLPRDLVRLLDRLYQAIALVRHKDGTTA